MVKASDILDAAEISALRQKSDLRGLALIIHAWAVIFGAMALFAWWPNPATFLLAAAIIAGRQLGLAILMHDAAHKLLLADSALNDRLGAWLCAYPVIADLALYRPYHLTHHR